MTAVAFDETESVAHFVQHGRLTHLVMVDVQGFQTSVDVQGFQTSLTSTHDQLPVSQPPTEFTRSVVAVRVRPTTSRRWLTVDSRTE